MSIEIEPEKAQEPAGSGPSGPARARQWWMRPAVHTGIIGAVIGYFVGHWLGNMLSYDYARNSLSDMNDFPLVLGYVFGTVGWLAGLGVFNDLIRQMLGKPVPVAEEEAEAASGLARYFRYTLDHKVVGLQYLVGMIVYFCTGGLFAMAIRTELLSPTYHIMNASSYLMVVGEHGTMMMMMMSSVVLGPFGQYLMPLMIGSKRMAYPRLEALAFWLTPAAYVVLLSGVLLGGFPTGWTGYAPLSVQATEGMDSYAVAFGIAGVALILAGFNIFVTIVNYRAPGMRWSRLPMFVWSMITVSFLMVLSVPVLVGGLYILILDRTAQTANYVNTLGGSSYLWENLFWYFGHPEVYIMAIPAMGLVLEMIPVFARKRLWGYRLAVVGLLGIALLSFLVWQHHLFNSGINADVRPFYSLSTELVSFPTGFIWLVALGTIWRSRMRFSSPMLFSLAFFFNFLVGGISGVYLADVASNVTMHGSYFVQAHFHYTIMGGLVFAIFGAIYYWTPLMSGIRLNERLAKWHFWTMFVFFNGTFLPLVRGGRAGDAAPGHDLRHVVAVPEPVRLDLVVPPGRLDLPVRDQHRVVVDLQA